MSAFTDLRRWASRHARFIWLLVLAYAAMPLAQALQPQAQWVDVPYCVGAAAPLPGVETAQPRPARSVAAKSLSTAADPASPAPAHAHLWLLLSPNPCPPGQAQQAALPTAAPALPLASCAAPLRPMARGYSLRPPTGHARPQPRAPPTLPAAA